VGALPSLSVAVGGIGVSEVPSVVVGAAVGAKPTAGVSPACGAAGLFAAAVGSFPAVWAVEPVADPTGGHHAAFVPCSTRSRGAGTATGSAAPPAFKIKTSSWATTEAGMPVARSLRT
jgi:hypothetical protein